MTRKGRLWTGATLVTVLLFNYAVMGIPLYRNSMSVKEKYRAALIRQARSAGQNAEDDYILDMFREKKAALERSALVLNCAAVSALIIIASWTVFGLFARRK